MSKPFLDAPEKASRERGDPMTDRESVARELHKMDVRNNAAVVPWGSMPKEHRAMYREDADRILEALRSGGEEEKTLHVYPDDCPDPETAKMIHDRVYPERTTGTDSVTNPSTPSTETDAPGEGEPDMDKIERAREGIRDGEGVPLEEAIERIRRPDPDYEPRGSEIPWDEPLDGGRRAMESGRATIADPDEGSEEGPSTCPECGGELDLGSIAHLVCCDCDWTSLDDGEGSGEGEDGCWLCEDGKQIETLACPECGRDLCPEPTVEGEESIQGRVNRIILDTRNGELPMTDYDFQWVIDRLRESPEGEARRDLPPALMALKYLPTVREHEETFRRAIQDIEAWCAARLRERPEGERVDMETEIDAAYRRTRDSMRQAEAESRAAFAELRRRIHQTTEEKG